MSNKRKNYFIERSFQSSFILKFCALVLLAGVLTTAILYLLGMRSTTVAIVNSRVVARTTADFLLPLLIQTVLIVMIFTSLAAIFVTLLISHKIAGPLYHFKKAIQLLSEGDFSKPFAIRSTDQFKGLACSFDNMIVKIRQEIKSLKEKARSLKENLDCLQEEDLPEQKRACLKELKSASEGLDKNINYFKAE